MISNEEKREVLNDVLEHFLKNCELIEISTPQKVEVLKFGLCHSFRCIREKEKYTLEVKTAKNLFTLVPELNKYTVKNELLTDFKFSPFGKSAILVRELMIKKVIEEIEKDCFLKCKF